jgi:hypothetical protein
LISKSGNTSVAFGVSDEALWAVVALALPGVEFGSSWAGDTEFSVPEGKVGWASTLVIFLVVNHGGSFDGGALALVVCGVDLSGGITAEALASLGEFTVGMVLGAGSTSHGERVEYIGSGTLGTVVSNLDESVGTALFDLVVAPGGVGASEGFGCGLSVLGKGTGNDCDQGKSLEEGVRHCPNQILIITRSGNFKFKFLLNIAPLF